MLFSSKSQFYSGGRVVLDILCFQAVVSCHLECCSSGIFARRVMEILVSNSMMASSSLSSRVADYSGGNIHLTSTPQFLMRHPVSANFDYLKYMNINLNL
jgi:hypothetical protein